MMKYILSTLIIFASLNFSLPFHDEMVGQFQLEECNGQLCVTVYLEKMNLVGALMVAKDCQPSKMVSICGDEYLQENFSITINQELQKLDLQSVDIQQQFVVYSYISLNNAPSIQQIEINNSYLNQLNDHGFSRFKFSFNDQIRHFNMNKERQTIKVVY